MNLVVMILVFFYRFQELTCLNMSTAKRLYTDLFTDYNTDIKPVSNMSDRTLVNATFLISGINNLNEKDGILSVVSALNLTWKDESLIWDPVNYGGIDHISVSTTKVWTPDIVLFNDAYKLAPIGKDADFKLTIRSDGSVNSIPGGVLNVKCAFDIQKFPFDSQTCPFEFIVWDNKMTMLIPGPKDYDISFFMPNHDWSLETISVVTNNIQALRVTLHLKREPLYYNVLVFTPTAVLSLLNPLVFILPIESGERPSFGMTILLSYVIFLTLVSDAIPATSNPMSFLIMFIVLLFITSSVITIFNIVSIRVYFVNKDNEIEGLTRSFVIRMSNRKRKNKIELMKDEVFTYKDLASVLDKLCFMLFYVIMFVLLVVYLVVMM